MRKTLLIVVLVGIGGCAGSQTVPPQARMGSRSPRAAPIKLEPPTISQRSRYNRRQQDEMAQTRMTKVEGNVVQ